MVVESCTRQNIGDVLKRVTKVLGGLEYGEVVIKVQGGIVTLRRGKGRVNV